MGGLREKRKLMPLCRLQEACCHMVEGLRRAEMRLLFGKFDTGGNTLVVSSSDKHLHGLG